jgi:hypothetical protein
MNSPSGHFVKDCLITRKKNCGRCGRNNYTISNCYAKTFFNGEKDCLITRKKNCGRCGRNNHTISNCYAKTFFNGEIIDDDEFLTDWMKLSLSEKEEDDYEDEEEDDDEEEDEYEDEEEDEDN